MKNTIVWGILLLTFAILPLYGRNDCESCHKHRHHEYKRESYDNDTELKQSRAGYTYSEESHPADYRDNIDRAKRGYDTPFGPFGRQDYEDYDDSPYRDEEEPENDYIQGSVWTNINADADYDQFEGYYESEEEYEDDALTYACNPIEYEDCSGRHPNYPYEEYARYSVSTDGNKVPTYVDYFPTLRGFPYYIGHQSGPFFGNGYGGF